MIAHRRRYGPLPDTGTLHFRDSIDMSRNQPTCCTDARRRTRLRPHSPRRTQPGCSTYRRVRLRPPTRGRLANRATTAHSLRDSVQYGGQSSAFRDGYRKRGNGNHVDREARRHRTQYSVHHGRPDGRSRPVDQRAPSREDTAHRIARGGWSHVSQRLLQQSDLRVVPVLDDGRSAPFAHWCLRQRGRVSRRGADLRALSATPRLPDLPVGQDALRRAPTSSTDSNNG